VIEQAEILTVMDSKKRGNSETDKLNKLRSTSISAKRIKETLILAANPEKDIEHTIRSM
jgi:hypothetical protein